MDQLVNYRELHVPESGFESRPIIGGVQDANPGRFAIGVPVDVAQRPGPQVAAARRGDCDLPLLKLQAPLPYSQPLCEVNLRQRSAFDRGWL